MKRGRIVCFLGIDGSGKSTLARMLSQHLDSRGMPYKRLWWLEAESSLTRRSMRKVFSGCRKTADDTEPEIDAPRGILAAVFQVLVLLDYHRQMVMKVLLPSIKGATVVCDRYVYDTVVAFSIEFGYSPRKYGFLTKLVESVFISPDVLILIDVPTEIAFSRKSDILSSASLDIPRKRYLEIGARRNALILDGTRDINELYSLAVRELEGQQADMK